ncbi:MAG: efflux RND transporter periplasmic adaptor subunit [Filimonas sp.]|nr:efflux RND transporter periplasmic adaptor subunit [Filimonas sp.]
MLRFHSTAILAVGVCIIGASCGKKKQQPKAGANQPPTVEVIVARNSSIKNVIEANGTVVANESVELHPEISGRITYLNVAEGKPIAAGTVIARINDADLQAQINKSKVQLDLAEKTEERLRKLLAVSGVNQADYDAALNTVNGYKADIAYTQALIDKTVIRAPFSGTLGLRQVSPGAYVTPSNVIVTLQQLNRLKIDFTIPEEYGKLATVGHTVDVEVDAASTVKRKATIIAVEPQANTITRNLKIRAILDNSSGSNPGAFVKVYVGEGVDKKAIMIPTNSIIPDDKNKSVVVVRKGNAVFTNVQTGLRQATNVEVIKGINEGDSVVVTGVLFALPNKPVKISRVKKLEEVGADSTTTKKTK